MNKQDPNPRGISLVNKHESVTVRQLFLKFSLRILQIPLQSQQQESTQPPTFEAAAQMAIPTSSEAQELIPRYEFYRPSCLPRQQYI